MKPKPADKIYVHEISAEELTENFPYHVCYIRKDALLEWAEEEMMKAAKQSDSYGRRNAFMDVIYKIESL